MPLISKPELGRNHVIVSPDNDGESMLSIDAAAIQDLYKEFGAIVFRSFEFDIEIFKAMTDKFCSTYIPNDQANRKFVSEDKRVQTVDLGDDAFPLHPELSGEPWKPDVAWFGCKNPPSKDGETLLCDGTELVDALPQAMREQLEKRGLLYRREVESTTCRYWLKTADPSEELMANTPDTCPFTFEKEGDQFIRLYRVPVLHKPMFTDRRAWGNFLLFARYRRETHDPTFEDGSIIPDEVVDTIRQTGEQTTVPLKWQKNDLLMADNSRFMHGRNAIHDADERQIYTTFGYLNFAIPGAHEPVDPPWRKLR